LALLKTNVFASLAHYACATDSAANDRSDRCALATTGNRANDCAYTCRSSDFRHVVLG
jgi:hypothetical protein